MKVIFKNPITSNYEVGEVLKTAYSDKTKKFTVVTETGMIYPGITTIKTRPGHVDFDITARIIDQIDTNLNKESQANYRNKNFNSPIKKYPF